MAGRTLKNKKNDNDTSLWSINGNGKDADGKFTITEGQVNIVTGRTYWVEKSENKSSSSRLVVNRGRFRRPNFDSFKGSWKANNGASGVYIRFLPKNKTKEKK